ncbi:MAG: hypothetical protein RMJ48_00685 [Roseiflexaceae bacterium]|nr:hypothetical protein [Roseiflexaceae bacterium]
MHGPAGRAVDISIDDWGIRERAIMTGEAQEVRLALASIRGCESGPELTVRIVSDISLLDLEKAPWYAGVAVQEIRAIP